MDVTKTDENDVFIVNDDREKLVKTNNLHQKLLNLLDMALMAIAVFLSALVLISFAYVFSNRNHEVASKFGNWSSFQNFTDSFHIEFCNPVCRKSGLKYIQEMTGKQVGCRSSQLDRDLLPEQMDMSRKSSDIITAFDYNEMCSVNVITKPQNRTLSTVAYYLGQEDEEHLILSTRSCPTASLTDVGCIPSPSGVCQRKYKFTVQRFHNGICHKIFVERDNDFAENPVANYMQNSVEHLNVKNKGCHLDRYILNTESYDNANNEPELHMKLFGGNQLLEELQLLPGFETKLEFGSGVRVTPIDFATVETLKLLTPVIQSLRAICNSFRTSSLEAKYPGFCGKLQQYFSGGSNMKHLLHSKQFKARQILSLLEQYIKQNIAVVKLSRCL